MISRWNVVWSAGSAQGPRAYSTRALQMAWSSSRNASDYRQSLDSGRDSRSAGLQNPPSAPFWQLDPYSTRTRRLADNFCRLPCKSLKPVILHSRTSELPSLPPMPIRIPTKIGCERFVQSRRGVRRGHSRVVLKSVAANVSHQFLKVLHSHYCPAAECV
jgi:hypothetical protein